MARIMRSEPAGLPAQIYFDERQCPEDDVACIPPADVLMAKEIMVVLEAHYRGHPWLVWVSHEQGVAVIKLPSLLDSRGLRAIGTVMGMVIHLRELASDPTYRVVVKRAGEYLERWRIDRGSYEPGVYAEARPAFNDKPIIGESRRG